MLVESRRDKTDRCDTVWSTFHTGSEGQIQLRKRRALALLAEVMSHRMGITAVGGRPVDFDDRMTTREGRRKAPLRHWGRICQEPVRKPPNFSKTPIKSGGGGGS